MKVNLALSTPRKLTLVLIGIGSIFFVGSAPAQIPAATPSNPAVATPQPSATPESTGPAHADDRYRIGPDDVLEIRVFNRPQLSRDSVRVDGRGMIRMPLIENDIRAACLTESELAEQLQKYYLEYLKNPQVDVFVKEFNSNPVSVVGAVTKPSRFQLQRKVRLLEVLTLAGGPTPTAGKFVQIIRSDEAVSCNDSPDTPTAPTGGVVSLELSQVLQGNEQANPYVKGGDVVSLPEVDQVFVVGNVYKPTNIPLRDPLTVSYAIAMAGGMLDDSNRENVRIIRQVPGSPTKKQILANLTAIRKDGANDIALQAGDIVEVPISGMSRFKKILTYTLAPAMIYTPINIIH
jgi:polysaccharide export outer membrane protein